MCRITKFGRWENTITQRSRVTYIPCFISGTAKRAGGTVMTSRTASRTQRWWLMRTTWWTGWGSSLWVRYCRTAAPMLPAWGIITEKGLLLREIWISNSFVVVAELNGTEQSWYNNRQWRYWLAVLGTTQVLSIELYSGLARPILYFEYWARYSTLLYSEMPIPYSKKNIWVLSTVFGFFFLF